MFKINAKLKRNKLKLLFQVSETDTIPPDVLKMEKEQIDIINGLALVKDKLERCIAALELIVESVIDET